MSDKELDELNIRHFKLSSGEEVVGIVVDTPSSSDGSEDPILTVQRPMLLETQTHPDRVMFLFHEWQPISKHDTCFINPFHVISHTECSNSVKEQYLHIALHTTDDPVEYADGLDFDESPLKIRFDGVDDSSSGNTYH